MSSAHRSANSPSGDGQSTCLMPAWTMSLAQPVHGKSGVGTGLVAPVTKTASFTLGSNENEVICNGTATITATFPAASSWVGRKVRIKTIAAFTVVSASSNVKPLDTDTAGTAILAATAGKYAELVSDGTNWVIMSGN